MVDELRHILAALGKEQVRGGLVGVDGPDQDVIARACGALGERLAAQRADPLGPVAVRETGVRGGIGVGNLVEVDDSVPVARGHA